MTVIVAPFKSKLAQITKTVFAALNVVLVIVELESKITRVIMVKFWLQLLLLQKMAKLDGTSCPGTNKIDLSDYESCTFLYLEAAG